MSSNPAPLTPPAVSPQGHVQQAGGERASDDGGRPDGGAAGRPGRVRRRLAALHGAAQQTGRLHVAHHRAKRSAACLSGVTLFQITVPKGQPTITGITLFQITVRICQSVLWERHCSVLSCCAPASPSPCRTLSVPCPYFALLQPRPALSRPVRAKPLSIGSVCYVLPSELFCLTGERVNSFVASWLGHC